MLIHTDHPMIRFDGNITKFSLVIDHSSIVDDNIKSTEFLIYLEYMF